MSAYRMTAKSLARLSTAVRSFNAAITRKEKELKAQGLERLIPALPSRKTVKEVKARINSRNDFRRIVGYANDRKHGRYSELNRVLKSVDPHALDVVGMPSGNIVTQYELKQERYNRAANVRRSKRLRDALDSEISAEGMSLPEEMTARDLTDTYLPDEGEPDDTYYGVDEATVERWRREDEKRRRASAAVSTYVENYLEAWSNPLNHHEDMAGYSDLISAMEYMERNDPLYLLTLFNMKPNELDVPYIIFSGPNNPYEGEDFEARHNRAVAYVTSRAERIGWKA